jgi:AcrR family transcriptional regulator
MRDIGEAAGCKTPTVYHYFENKEKLFDEVVRVAYINLLDELRTQLPEKMSPQDYSAETIIQKKHLSEEDMLVHRIAIKTWLGCEGCDEVRQKLIEWDDARKERSETLLTNIVASKAWVKVITRTFMNLMERIILFNENIPDDEIREETRLLFEAATKNKIIKSFL